MSDLSNAVQRAQADLSAVCSMVHAVPSGLTNTTMGLNILGTWLQKAKLNEALAETVKLFECRVSALKGMENLRENASKFGSKPISETIVYGTAEIPIFAARLLSIESYLAVTWSIYDRLSNVLGRLMGDAKVVDNTVAAQNPKLVEDLIGQAKGCYQGFGTSELLSKLYGEPIYSSYFLRNSFVHDGGMMGNVPILSGSSAAACFELSKENAEKINQAVARQSCGLGSGLFNEGDFIGQLKMCHDDLDKMFIALSRFVVGSFCAQVSLFCGKIGINPATNTELG